MQRAGTWGKGFLEGQWDRRLEEGHCTSARVGDAQGRHCAVADRELTAKRHRQAHRRLSNLSIVLFKLHFYPNKRILSLERIESGV
jgi:hypothetical protein